jgi:beta-lactamase class A
MNIPLSPSDIQAIFQRVGIDRSAFILTSLDDAAVTIELEPAADIYPASMMKLALAAAIAIGLKERRLQDRQLAIGMQHITTDDAPAPFAAGYRASVWELIHAMISASNNTATNVLLDYAGRREASQALHAIGCTRTNLRRYLSGSLPRLDDPLSDGENEHPACDAALLFHKIADRTLPYHDQLLAALNAQIWNTKFSSGLQSDDTFAHKTGETTEYCHDGGILTLANGKRYILVLYTALPANEETDAKFGEIMRELRQHLI